MIRDELDQERRSLPGLAPSCAAGDAGGAVDCRGQDGGLRERSTGPGAAALADLVTWTDSRWASVPLVWAARTDSLCECQRLLLGLVLFGRMRYRAAAACTGVPAQLVSALCLAALRQLRDDQPAARGVGGSGPSRSRTLALAFSWPHAGRGAA